MRMLLKIVAVTEAANEFFRSGGVSESTDRLVERLQPEAYYGFVEDRQRTAFIVFDMADPWQIPALTEPMYQQGKAKVTLTPCMNREDLETGFEELASQMEAVQGQSAQ
jgi:hypothetical protein